MTEEISEAEAISLLKAAREAKQRAYAPYSGFSVGAAVRTMEGEVFVGANVENASYGLSICAERVAIFSAVAAGARSFDAIAVSGPNDGVPCFPCGSCRQVLYEFAPAAIVLTESPQGSIATPLTSLLPEAFGPEDLRGGKSRINAGSPGSEERPF